MILNDRQIRERCTKEDMIRPFEERMISSLDGKRVVSYGTSSYGYDARLDRDFKIFTPISPNQTTLVDPKNFDPAVYVDHQGDFCIIPPHSFILASTLEWFNVPRDIMVICVGKSTYARCGLFVGVTPLEPEWRGHVTIEISNTTPLPARVYAKEGIAQFLFFEAKEYCEMSYADRKGKYQDQIGLTLPKV